MIEMSETATKNKKRSYDLYPTKSFNGILLESHLILSHSRQFSASCMFVCVYVLYQRS